MNARRRAMCAALLLWGLAGGSGVQAGGVPVIDASNLAQAMEQVKALGEQLKRLEEQVQTAKAQLDSLREQAQTLKDMYTDFSGVTQHAKMFADAVRDYHSYIPAELLDPGAMVKGELAGLIGQLRAAQEKYTAEILFPNADQEQEREGYRQQSDFAFGYRAHAQQAYARFAERRAALESLATAGTTATTPKATLDLIAKTSAEHALLLNDIAQMLALQLGATADREILDHNLAGLRAREGKKSAQVQFR